MFFHFYRYEKFLLFTFKSSHCRGLSLSGNKVPHNCSLTTRSPVGCGKNWKGKVRSKLVDEDNNSLIIKKK